MSKDLPPSRTAEQFVVRFPDGMRDRIAQAAKENNRSMNSEIVARLEQSFEPKQPHMDLATMAKAIQEMRGTLSNQQQYIAELVERGYSVKVDQEGILSAQHTFRKPAPQAKTITIENPPEEGSIPAPPAAKRAPKKAAP